MQHGGTMTRGAPQLSITIVPDSGTGDLTGIAGSCGITSEDGSHVYELHYTLPDHG
jgi:acyl CoA:acetate/3-ketoacid CoA transferase alpha subunit